MAELCGTDKELASFVIMTMYININNKGGTVYIVNPITSQIKKIKIDIEDYLNGHNMHCSRVYSHVQDGYVEGDSIYAITISG